MGEDEPSERAAMCSVSAIGGAQKDPPKLHSGSVRTAQTHPRSSSQLSNSHEPCHDGMIQSTTATLFHGEVKARYSMCLENLDPETPSLNIDASTGSSYQILRGVFDRL